MDPLSKLADPTKLTGNLVNNFQSALNELSKTAGSELTSQAKNLPGALSGGISALTGGLTGTVSSLQGAASKLAGAVTNPAALLGKLAGNAGGAFAQVQSLLDSVGNMGGQIKAPIFASGTIDTSAITAKIGKLLGDARIPLPSYEEYVSETTANSYQEAQSEAIGKISEIESKMEIINVKLANISSSDPNSATKITSLNNELASLDSQLETAQQAYERTITGSA